MSLTPDDDILTHLLAVKWAHVDPAAVKKAVDSQENDKHYRPLVQVLYERKTITREQMEGWLLPQSKQKILSDLVEREKKFWRASGPKRFGPYVTTRTIGGGGRGLVFEAVADGETEPVALKVLSEEHSFDLHEIERFLREERILSRMDHLGIPRIRQTGWEGSIPYCTMDFVRGIQWGNAIDSTRSPTWTVAILISVLEILDHVHSKLYVHCDVKPENIVFTPEGKVYLMDFGVAMRLGKCHEKGIAIGTPVYMSPEQAEGGVPLDARTDVYSTGAVLYELLTRVQPYEGESKDEIVDLVLAGKMKRPREVRPDVPEPLERVILKAMERNPRHRYESAKAMGEDLRRWQAGKEVEAKPRRFWRF